MRKERCFLGSTTLVIATVIAVIGLFISVVALPSPADASSPKPRITDFVATPAMLIASGGVVTFSATMTLEGSCTVTAKPSFAGLPKTSDACGTGIPSVTVPANPSKKSITYKFKIEVTGLFDPTKKASASTAVTVSPPASEPYVALGDSFSAGYDNPGPTVTTGGVVQTADDGCDRTTTAYPMLLSRWLDKDTALPPTTLRFLACTGATTTDLWSGSPAVDQTPRLAGASLDNNEPVQLSDPDLSNARIVTLSIGGNDIYFKSVLQDCLLACGASSPYTPVTDLDVNIANLEPVLEATYSQVHTEAPMAAIYVMGYPYPVPLNSTVGGRGTSNASSYSRSEDSHTLPRLRPSSTRSSARRRRRNTSTTSTPTSPRDRTRSLSTATAPRTPGSTDSSIRVSRDSRIWPSSLRRQ